LALVDFHFPLDLDLDFIEKFVEIADPLDNFLAFLLILWEQPLAWGLFFAFAHFQFIIDLFHLVFVGSGSATVGCLDEGLLIAGYCGFLSLCWRIVWLLLHFLILLHFCETFGGVLVAGLPLVVVALSKAEDT
jgi:hypothetical protein